VLPFHDNWNLFPYVGATQREVYGSLSTIGSDALGTQSYVLGATYSTLSKFVGGTAIYSNDQFEPTFSLGVQANANIFSRFLVVPATPGHPCFGFANRAQTLCFGTPNGDYFERRLQAQFSIGLPFLQRHLFSLSYNFQERQSLDALPAGTRTDFLPAPGRYARVALGYSYSFVRSFPYSISLERGTSVNVALLGFSRGLGGQYEEFELTSEGRFYLSLPWNSGPIHNHVLATRLAVGITGGPDLADSFQLGGKGTISPLTTITENFYPLRGIDTGSLAGPGVLAGSVEYRAPIFRLDHGPGTLPLTLSVLHAAVFADVGRIFKKTDWTSLHTDFFNPFAIGVGAELRGDITFAYNFPLTVVVGYAYALKTPSDNASVAASGPYFTFGTAF
jgi:hypothetical protein